MSTDSVDAIRYALEAMYAPRRELMETYAHFPIRWHYVGSDEVHEIKPDVRPAFDWLRSRQPISPPVEPKEYIQPWAADVKKELRPLRKRRCKRMQQQFDRYITYLRRCGHTRLANRVIIRDLVKGWPRRNGLTI